MRPLLGPTRYRACLVCSARTPNAHLGVDACRACATFFRRAAVSKTRYICRQGHGMCEVVKDDQHFCKRCRLDKCIAAGMGLRESTDSASDPRASCSSYHSSSSDDSSLETPILNRFTAEFQAYCQRRHRSEKHLLASEAKYPESYAYSYQTGEDFLISSCEYEDDMTPVAVVDFFVLLRRAFPEFGELDEVDQRGVVKNVFWKFLLLENHYFHYKRFAQCDRYFTSGHTTVYDVQDPGGFIVYDIPTEKKEEIARHFMHYYRTMMSFTQPLFVRADPTEFEYSALFALLVWRIEGTNHSDELLELGGSMRRRIFSELASHCRNQGQTTPCSERIGLLVTIATTIDESRKLMGENMHIFELLELFRRNSYVTKMMYDE